MKRLSNCPPVESWMQFLQETYPGHIRAGLAQHLDTCPRCQQVVEHLCRGNATWLDVAKRWQRSSPGGVAPELDPAREPEESRRLPRKRSVRRASGPLLSQCPDCGRLVSRQAYQCPQCGRPFNRPPQPPQRSSGGLFKGFVGVVLGSAVLLGVVVMLICGGIAVYSIRNGDAGPVGLNWQDSPPQPPADQDENLINYVLALDTFAKARLAVSLQRVNDPQDGCRALEWFIQHRKEVLSGLRDLPDDFRTAYLANTHAVEAVLADLRAGPQNALDVLGLLVADWLEEGRLGQERRAQQQELVRRIQATNADLERTAVAHGARIDWRAGCPLVVEVTPGSHGDRAGVQPMWLFLDYNGVSLQNLTLGHNVCREAMEAAPRGGMVTVSFLTPDGIVTKTVPGGEMLGIKVRTADSDIFSPE
jgi:hypothetical protein